MKIPEDAVRVLVSPEDYQPYMVEEAERFLAEQKVGKAQVNKLAKRLYAEKVKAVLDHGTRIRSLADLPGCPVLKKKDREAIGRRVVKQVMQGRKDRRDTDYSNLWPY